MATDPTTKRIGLLTGGGDCPGLNAVIRAVSKSAMFQHDIEVVGILNGYEGLIRNQVELLTPSDVSGILTRGGTILGSNNRISPQHFPVEQNGKTTFIDATDQCLRTIEEHRIDAMIVVGGDGTIACTMPLVDAGVPCIGVPKTIDNDILGTDLTFGFTTAMTTATLSLDRLHTTADSHHRVMVCELMEMSLQQKLLNKMQSGKKIKFDEGLRIAIDVSSALHYMHSRRPFAVIHRDIKPANILLTHGGTAKVADFGLSRMLDIDTPRVPKNPDGAPEVCPSPFLPSIGVAPPTGDAAEAAERKTADFNDRLYSQLYDHAFLMTGETGAYKYMAPEVFRHEFYGLKCDAYSYAMVVYEVFEGLLMLKDPVTWAHGASGSRRRGEEASCDRSG